VKLAPSWVAALALLSAAPADAQTKREARLEYTRGAGADHCPEEEAIRAAVSARLGYEPFRADATTTVSAKITRTGRVLRADVELRDGAGNVAGTRQLTSKQNDCSELVAAMTLAISIAIDPESQTRPSPPPAEAVPISPATPDATGPGAGPGVPPGTAAKPPVPIPDRVLPSRRSARLVPPIRGPEPIVLRTGAGALLALGTAPGVSVGFATRLGVGWRSLSADLEARLDLPASTAGEGRGSVSAMLIAASLVPCWHRGPLLACGLGSLGAIRGKGEGVPSAHADATLFWAIGARLGAELALDERFSGVIYGDVTAIGTPTTLRLDERDVWSTAPIGVAVGAAVQAHFP